MLKVYPAIFHEENGQFWVEFPDLPGCNTYGETLEETLDSASEALGLYLYAKKEDHLPLPKASDIMGIAKPEDGFTTLVSCDLTKFERRTKAVKKTLSIPEWLNEEAERRHINFSSVLQKALLQQIHD